MTDPNSQSEKPEDKRRYDPELLEKGLRCDLDQYGMLIGCSKKKDVKEWNEWRKEHLGDEILLEGADLLGAHLHGVELSDYGGVARSPTVCLKGATLLKANLGHALLAIQVILGYVLMGALVTRFAVLFTAGGPAGKFADDNE